LQLTLSSVWAGPIEDLSSAKGFFRFRRIVKEEIQRQIPSNQNKIPVIDPVEIQLPNRKVVYSAVSEQQGISLVINVMQKSEFLEKKKEPTNGFSF
jgi:hypothetical protein